MNFLEYLLQESIEDKGIFKACFMGGQSASGKTFVISKISAGSIEPRMVNTDTWTEFFKAYGDKSWSQRSEKIKLLTKKQLSLYLNSLLPLWIDGTSASPPAVFRRVGILKSLGYDVSMVWVNCSLETSLERAKKRERPVPPETITDIYNKIQELKPYYRSEFKTFVEINNDIGELTDDVILKSFKRMQGWFLSPIENPIGKQLYDSMRENKHKYLIDTGKYTLPQINKLVDSWYRS